MDVEINTALKVAQYLSSETFSGSEQGTALDWLGHAENIVAIVLSSLPVPGILTDDEIIEKFGVVMPSKGDKWLSIAEMIRIKMHMTAQRDADYKRLTGKENR